MSKNFDILRNADKARHLFELPSRNIKPPEVKPRPSGIAPSHEEVIKLVQRVFLSSISNAPRVVIFCAAEPGNGCSWVCARAAETLALQGGSTVCLVDANLRTPTLHQHFRLENGIGLTDAVLQDGPIQSFLTHVEAMDLWLMTSGTAGPDSQALLNTDRFKFRMQELRSQYSYVIIDGPPVKSYADAALLGQLTDGMILVLEANATRRETARKVKESLEAAKVNLLGVVLNKRTFPIPEKLYHKL